MKLKKKTKSLLTNAASLVTGAIITIVILVARDFYFKSNLAENNG